MGNGIIFKVAVGVCCALAVFALASCAPKGAAVGDTGAARPDDPAHVDSPGETQTVAIVGSADGADGLVEEALDADGYKVVLMTPGASVDAADARLQAVRDAVGRNVSLIVIGEPDMSRQPERWRDMLRLARDAGIPVVLLDPVSQPDDDELFAASFRVNDRMMDAVPVGEAVRRVIEDEPHGRDVIVTTLH
ncbi:sugar ABC transporter periplasmic protein [Bifidobacterium italicum]|uniref:Sugar ABC transporter periplasmic protein n=2 Tax=Bifidobacterium italicum TaxID=1960968 RepID=A0A2A2EIQ1_9BIFI|nr:sugar ABC transporter periplasmic protein [Bifidobacterium italicum]